MRSELEKYKVDIERWQVEGEVIRKPRKKRSDTGTSCKCKTAPRGDKENEPLTKQSREKRCASQRQPKSCEIIEDSDVSQSTDNDKED